MKVSLLAPFISLLMVGGVRAQTTNADAAASTRPAVTQLARTGGCSSLPHVRSLRNLDCAEATALVEQLRSVQRKLKAGEPLTFHLLSGAPALDPTTKVAPRDAFLQMRFDKAFIVERLETDSRTRRPYTLAIKPGAHRFIWKVEVVRGFYGQFERVEMFYGPPPPF